MSDDKLSTNDHVDHQRWMLERGFINDLHKDTLYMYGALLHKQVEAVELAIDVERRIIKYNVYVSKSLLKKIKQYERLLNSGSIVGLWRLKRMIKKEGNLNLRHVLDRFVKDYCGPRWNADLDVLDFRDYEDGFKEESEQSEDSQVDQQPDQG